MNVEAARKHCKAAFDSWKSNDFNITGKIHNDYGYKCKESPFVADFFNHLKVKKINNLSLKLRKNFFGRFLKTSNTQMHAFLIEGKLLSDVNKIHDMWANDFEALGTPFASSNFDNGF